MSRRVSNGDSSAPIEIDGNVAHVARVNDYLLVRHEAPFDRAG